MIFFAIPVPLIIGAWFVYMFSWIYHYGRYYAEKQFMNAELFDANGWKFNASLARFWGHIYMLICYIFRVALFMAGAGIGWYFVLHIWQRL